MSQAQIAPELARRRRRILRAVKLGLVLAVAAAGVVGLVMVRRARARQSEMEVVRTAKVIRGDLVQTVSCTGVIAAETGAYVKIGSQISGRIRRLYADLGQQVRAGQVIAEIDAPDLAANLEAARRNAEQARARYLQQLAGAPMQHTQLIAAYEQAQEGLRGAESERQRAQANVAAARSRLKSVLSAQEGAQARLREAEARLSSSRAAVKLQSAQTDADVKKAKAAVNTAEANLRQAEKSYELEIADAQAALKQAEANATLAAAELKRQEGLFAKGFASQADVDNARAQAEVTAQQVEAARSRLDLTREKVEAALAAARDALAQARAGLAAAEAGVYQDAMRAEDVKSAEAAVEDAKAAVAQAAEAVASARADLAAAEAQAGAAEAQVRSAKAAVKTALANMTQDQIKQREIQAAYEALKQAEAQVKYQEAQFQKSYIRSPISGTVVTLAQQEGETVAAGLSAPTLIEVVDLNRLQVNAYVDETDIGQVRVGQEAKVSVDAFPDKEFKGQVVTVASAATVQENVVTYLVTVKLESQARTLLKPQMTASVDIMVQKRQNVLLVPNEAVKMREGEAKVVVLKDGQGEVRTVETGLSDGESTEIISGLQEGEEVVLAGFEKLGIEGFSSEAELPGFLRRMPFGPAPAAGARRGSGGSRGR